MVDSQKKNGAFFSALLTNLTLRIYKCRMIINVHSLVVFHQSANRALTLSNDTVVWDVLKLNIKILLQDWLTWCLRQRSFIGLNVNVV